MATVDRKAAFAWMCKLERGFSLGHFAEKFGITPRAAKHILVEFRKRGAVQNFGIPPNARWEVMQPDADIECYADRQHPNQLAALARANHRRMMEGKCAQEVMAWWPPKTELEKCWSGTHAAIDTDYEKCIIDNSGAELCPQE